MYVCVICISVFRTYLVFLCLASNGVNLCDSSGSHLYLVVALVFLFLFLCMSRGGVVFDLCCVFFCMLCFCVFFVYLCFCAFCVFVYVKGRDGEGGVGQI